MAKPLRLALAASLGAAAAAPALAQSAGNYGLSELKSYDAPVAPPANGLARVIRSEHDKPADPQAKFQPNPPLTVSVHGYGEVVVDSTMRR